MKSHSLSVLKSPILVVASVVMIALGLTACTATPAANSNSSSSSSAAQAAVTWCITEPEKAKVCYPPIAITDGETAYQSFVELDQREDTVSFEATNYGDSGYFVTSIDGIKGDSQHFWKLFQNNTEAQVGISSIKPQDKDILEFQYAAVQ